MTKAELIAQVAAEASITKKAAEKVVNSMVRILSDTLKKDGRLALAGFGTFMLRHREARKGRDPQTGEPIKIPAAGVVKFNPAKQLNQIVNIYGPVGALQTGDAATANVIQKIDTETKDQLIKILAKISSKLSKSDPPLPYPKEDIIELVQEAQQELKKSSPNIKILAGILFAIGSAIQTIAAFKPAYDTLKYTLNYIGIHLP